MITCIECNREYEYDRRKGCTKTRCNSCLTNSRRFQLRRKIIEYMGGKCVECGYNECLGALHPHHLNGEEKSFRLSGAHSRSWKLICEEMDKCILLCANCHFKNHHPCDRYSCNTATDMQVG